MLFIFFLVFEIITLGLTTIWFAGGAFISFWLAYFGVGFHIQLLVFAVVSGVLVFTTRPLAVKYVNKKNVRTNVDDLVGRTVKVSETIDNINQTGHVVINGVDWMARSRQEGMVIQKDTMVTITEITGVKVIVQPVGILKTAQGTEH